jgi:hypothetical protein
VKKAAIISAVGQYSTFNSLTLMQTVTKKYQILIWHVCLLLEALPLFSNNIALGIQLILLQCVPVPVGNIESTRPAGEPHLCPPTLPWWNS